MALTGTLLADFSAFVNESAKATTAVKGMESSADTAATKLAKLQPAAQDSAKAFGDLSQQIAATFTGMVSGEAVVSAVSTGFQALTGFVESSVAAYSKQEDATVKLTAALRQHGLATPQVIAQYDALATSFQGTTRYADEEIQAMERLLTLVGNVMPSQMKDALKASTDLAAGLGIDLEKATMLVAKAAAGHTETLGRYGITVDAAAVQTRGLSAVLDVINEKFGGQAAAAIETYSGRITQAANAWDNVKEALGKIIVDDPLVTNALNHLVSGAKDADKAASDARPTLAGLAADFGLIDRGTATAIDGLEAYVDALNTTAQATRIINALPSPFEKMAKDMTAPAITAGFELNAKLLKEHEDQVKKDAKAAEEWEKANTAVNASLVTWQDTLATVDKGLQEDIKIALSSGVSQKELAIAWGLTEAQIKAVSIALTDYATALNTTADFEKDAAARRKEITKQMTAAINDQIVATLKAKQADQDFLDAGVKAAQQADEATRAQAKSSAAAYEAQLKVNGAVLTTANTIHQGYTNAFDAAKKSFEDFQGVVVAGTHAMADAVSTFGMSEAMASGNYAEMQAAMRQAQFEHGGFYVGLQTGAPPVMQTRDSGGPVVAGQSYLIGGGKAPEIFTPGASGFVTPGGAGGSHVTQNIYITQPLGTADAIARAVADAQVNLMRGQGVRLPYGT
jgi:hypothetical protein